MSNVEENTPNGHFRLAWKDRSTGATGHGEWFAMGTPECANLSEWRDRMNKEYPRIDHWLENTQLN